MSDTSIQWTEKTWNPVTGCTKVSAGCKNCYAEGVANRFWGKQYRPVLSDGSGKTIDVVSTSHHEQMLADGTARPRRFTDIQWHADRLDQPLRWRKPAKVFVNSMSDLFHEDVPAAFIADVFAVMARAPQHTFQVLTKRAERMRMLLSDPPAGVAWPLPNVWLGVSVESQHFAEERIPLLLQTPAAIRFISAEPLLSGIDIRRWIGGSDTAVDDMEPEDEHCVRCGCYWDPDSTEHECPPGFGPRLDWVIIGGESGRGARPFHTEWASTIVRQCQAVSVPVFVKQLGADPRWGPDGWLLDMLRDPKGGDISEWPDYYVGDLKVRQFPAERATS